ncbi:hypothetical protein D3C75_1094760 [compost metagenome]
MHDATSSIQIETIMGPDAERTCRMNARITKMVQDLRLQNDAPATTVHRRRGSLVNIDLPTNRA